MVATLQKGQTNKKNKKVSYLLQEHFGNNLKVCRHYEEVSRHYEKDSR